MSDSSKATSTHSQSSGRGSSSGATSMAELMARHTSTLQTLQKGQVITGKITKLTPSEVTMDVNAKTEAIVMEKDRRLLKQLLSQLHVGDTVEATVIYPEAENGYPVVSLRRFIEDRLWVDLEKIQKSGEKVTVTVTEATKGGFLVEAENGANGFLPNSHVVGDTADLVGQKVLASIVELNRENKKVVFSQKAVLSDDDFKKIQQQYKAGTKITGKISGITTFGVFVSLPFTTSKGEEVTVDGLIHISEVSWDKVEDLNELFNTGDTVDAVVIGGDKDGKRIDLSIKKLSKDPFAQISESFPVDKKVSGVVKEMNDQGLLIDLGTVGDIEVDGMIKKDKISPTTSYEVGQKVTATVTQIDAKRRKVMLTPVLLEKPLMYR